MIALAVILVLLAFVAFYAIAIYNKLVKLKNLMAEAWSVIDVQLKKRYDLVPDLSSRKVRALLKRNYHRQELGT